MSQYMCCFSYIYIVIQNEKYLKIYEEVFEILFNVFVFIYKWLLSFVLEYEYSKSTPTRVRVHEYDYSISAIYIVIDIPVRLKGPKREKLHAMHVKELIKTNYFER